MIASDISIRAVIHFTVLLSFVYSRDTHDINENVVDEKGHLILVFVLLTVAAWILRSIWSADVTVMHAVHWPSVPSRKTLAGRKPGCGWHIETFKFLITSVEFVLFSTFIQNPYKGNPSLSERPSPH